MKRSLLDRLFGAGRSDPLAEGAAWARRPPAGVVLGAGCRVQGRPRVKLAAGASIACGPGVVLNSDPEGYHAGMAFPVTLLADRPGASISIGAESRLHGCCIHAWSQVRIGRRCLVAASAQILDAHGHATETRFSRLRERIRDEPEAIELGDHCWVGLGALISKGARLGEGCIVAAHAVVGAGDVPPFSLLAGNPARIVHTGDPDEVLDADAALESLGIPDRLYHY